MCLDFRPSFVPAPRAKQVWRHAQMETSLILRNGEQLILAVVIPLGILISGRCFGDRFGLSFAELAPSVLGVVMWSSGLTTLAISTGFERRYHVLERIAATPLGKGGVLLGKGISIAMMTVGQVLLLTAIGLMLGWRPTSTPLAALVTVATSLAALAAFIALGLAISGALRPETTLAVANLLFLVGLPLGIVVPVAAFPAWVQPILHTLPTAALGESLRAGSTGAIALLPLVVAAAWAGAATLLARKVFQWTS